MPASVLGCKTRAEQMITKNLLFFFFVKCRYFILVKLSHQQNEYLLTIQRNSIKKNCENSQHFLLLIVVSSHSAAVGVVNQKAMVALTAGYTK